MSSSPSVLVFGTGSLGRAGLLALPLLTGCIEFGLDPIEPDGGPTQRVTLTDEFLQAPLPKVDLLWVIDRTASMDQELDALVDAADLLGAQLDEAGIAWQLGVVSADVSTAQAGWLLGTPWVLAPPEDPALHLEAILAQPAAAAEEAGIGAAIQALALARGDGVNAGFRRPDASLHVVFVSDGDDASDAAIGADPVGAMQDALAIEAENGLPAMASAVVGDVPGGCTSPFGSAQAGERYAQLAALTGGATVSICATNFAPVVDAIGATSIVLTDTFVLREEPASDKITVTVDGARADGWTFVPGTAEQGPSIRFEIPPPAGAVVVVSYTVKVSA